MRTVSDGTTRAKLLTKALLVVLLAIAAFFVIEFLLVSALLGVSFGNAARPFLILIVILLIAGLVRRRSRSRSGGPEPGS